MDQDGMSEIHRAEAQQLLAFLKLMPLNPWCSNCIVGTFLNVSYSKFRRAAMLSNGLHFIED
jgi:hypothetical protein